MSEIISTVSNGSTHPGELMSENERMKHQIEAMSILLSDAHKRIVELENALGNMAHVVEQLHSDFHSAQQKSGIDIGFVPNDHYNQDEETDESENGDEDEMDTLDTRENMDGQVLFIPEDEDEDEVTDEKKADENEMSETFAKLLKNEI